MCTCVRGCVDVCKCGGVGTARVVATHSTYWCQSVCVGELGEGRGVADEDDNDDVDNGEYMSLCNTFTHT